LMREARGAIRAGRVAEWRLDWIARYHSKSSTIE
jgi:hypothetical protein